MQGFTSDGMSYFIPAIHDSPHGSAAHPGVLECRLLATVWACLFEGDYIRLWAIVLTEHFLFGLKYAAAPSPKPQSQTLNTDALGSQPLRTFALTLVWPSLV